MTSRGLFRAVCSPAKMDSMLLMAVHPSTCSLDSMSLPRLAQRQIEGEKPPEPQPFSLGGFPYLPMEVTPTLKFSMSRPSTPFLNDIQKKCNHKAKTFKDMFSGV